MIGFGVGAAKGECRIQRLPAKGEFGPLGRTEVAEVFISFLVTEFKRIKSGNVPDWTRYREQNFPVNRPNVPAPGCRREIYRTYSFTSCTQSVGCIASGLSPMFGSKRDGD